MLIDWVRSGRAGKYLALGQEVRTERSEVRTSWPRAKYFPVRPDLTQSISILSYDHLLLKILKILFEPKYIRSDGCARGTITWKFLQQKFVIYFFTSSKKLTIHRKPQLIFSFFLMLKSQQKVDIKLSKICQSHQKLSEWQKVASRFTEIVVKTHENVGVISSHLSGYLSTSWILL